MEGFSSAACRRPAGGGGEQPAAPPISSSAPFSSRCVLMRTWRETSSCGSFKSLFIVPVSLGLFYSLSVGEGAWGLLGAPGRRLCPQHAAISSSSAAAASERLRGRTHTMVPGRLLAVGCEYQRPSGPGLTLNLQIESVHPVSGLAALWCLSRAAGEFCLR